MYPSVDGAHLRQGGGRIPNITTVFVTAAPKDYGCTILACMCSDVTQNGTSHGAVQLNVCSFAFKLALPDLGLAASLRLHNKPCFPEKITTSASASIAAKSAKRLQ